jgi:cobyrinic acid a,c-diamide synthase
MKSIIIAAPQSGSGKTTITLGLMEYFRRRGLTVAPFKVGPDFIDPGYHRLVCGRPSINLDGWICPPEFVRETFQHNSKGADIAVIEGVMGLFDGISGQSDQGSTAHVAKITGAPVVLVVDARSQARSAAALVKGFSEFDPRIRLAGVIFNNVASDSHARILREAIESLVEEIPALGFIPREERLHIPSRHLGLLSADENPLSEVFLDHLAAVVRDHVDLGLLWMIGTQGSTDLDLPFGDYEGSSQDGERESRVITIGTGAAESRCYIFDSGDGEQPVPTPAIRIALARDQAFCFVYEDNLRLLREAGAELVPFSPLRDELLPIDISGIYLPGGYPEIFADSLKEKRGIMAEIRNAIEAGMPVYAECGGFIYLSEGVEMMERGHVGTAQNDAVQFGDLAPMVGIFPAHTRMLARRKALGYREVEFSRETLLGPKGRIARGHEFHYSEMGKMPASVERSYRVRKSGMDLGSEGYTYKNCLASYVHLHFGSCPGMAESFVVSCRKFKDLKSLPQRAQRKRKKGKIPD